MEELLTKLVAALHYHSGDAIELKFYTNNHPQKYSWAILHNRGIIVEQGDFTALGALKKAAKVWWEVYGAKQEPNPKEELERFLANMD